MPEPICVGCEPPKVDPLASTRNSARRYTRPYRFFDRVDVTRSDEKWRPVAAAGDAIRHRPKPDEPHNPDADLGGIDV